MLTVQIQSSTYTGLISEDEYRQHLRYEGTDQAAILPVYLEAAIRQAEDFCNASFGAHTIAATFTEAVSGKRYELPFGQVTNVTSVTNTEGAAVTTYELSHDKSFITFTEDGNYIVTYTAGGTINNEVKVACLMIMSELFENRENSGNAGTMPMNSRTLLSRHRRKIL